jgi:hypothetical protein
MDREYTSAGFEDVVKTLSKLFSSATLVAPIRFP